MAEQTITYNNSQLEQYIPGSNRYKWRDALMAHPGYTDKKTSATFPLVHNTNLQILFTKILIPVETGFSTKYAINSCYRNPAINGSDVGAGQHGTGQAADISCNGNMKMNKDMFHWMKDNPNLLYDQLIWEGSDPAPAGAYPRWIHVSYDPNKAKQRRVVYWWNGGKYNPWTAQPNNQPSGQPGPGDGAGTEPDKTTTSTEQEKQKMADAEDPAEKVKSANWDATLKRAAENQAFLEASEVDVTWGKGIDPKDSDWISLKQFMLYLATRHTPQSVVPFIELIPSITIEGSTIAGTEGATYQADGQNKEVEEKVASNPKSFKEKIAAAKEKLAKFQKLVQEKKEKIFEASQTMSREEVGIAAFNNAAGSSDLFSLDPFRQEFDIMGVESESGKTIRGLRNIGVRAYGQLVLSPGAIEGAPSKPGPIGFKDLEIQAGAQCENGLAMISMSIIDVQGNKFTDLNSPWSFIYDARPGNIGGDFWFRYGWNIRLPDPEVKGDRTSQLFWNHPGWAMFGEPVKDWIKKNLNPANPVMLLTQSINKMGTNVYDSNNQLTKTNLDMFDEGVSYDSSSGSVIISRDTGYLLNNYVKLSILNPELSIDDNSAIIAKLSFRTTGAVAQSVPIIFASRTRQLIRMGVNLTLGDLILTIMYDGELSGYLAIDDEEKRNKAMAAGNTRLHDMLTNRDFEGLCYVMGLEEGGNTGGISPDDLRIEVKDDFKDILLNPPNPSEDTIIGWFRNVLQDNGMELNSAATGSGAGINAAWVITVTEDYDRENYIPKKKDIKVKTTDYTDALDLMLAEKDVFAYRHQGSLVTNMTMEKTEGDNALKIEMDYNVSDMETNKSDDKKPLTLEKFKERFKSSTTMDSRKRNLKVLFSQLQTCKITCMCHPWVGPGKKVFVKGMGMFDGEYMVLEVTHSLGSDMIFKSEIKGGRILAKSEDATTASESKLEATANGNSNMATMAAGASIGGAAGAVGSNPAGDKLTNDKTIAEEEYKKRKASFESEFNELKAQWNTMDPTLYAQKRAALYAKYSDIVDRNGQPVKSPLNVGTSAAFGGVTGAATGVSGSGPATPPQLPKYSDNVNQVMKIDKNSDY